MNRNPKDFYAYANIKHWSGCWGGHLVQENIPNPTKYIERFNENTKWLTNFLKNTDLDNLRLDLLIGTEDGKSKDLSGQEYITRVRLQDTERFLRNSAIMTCIDGKPAVAMPEYDHLAIGEGMFKGYKLENGRARYTLTLPYTLTNEGYPDHTSFACPPYQTIIIAHLFNCEQELTGNVDFSGMKPTVTSILFFDPAHKIKKIRRRK